MPPNKDFIKELGVMALGTRLKRLSDRLNKSVSMIYRDLDSDFEPGWFIIIYRLKDKPRLSVTELAAELGLTHPGVIKISNQMAKKGLLKSTRDKDDDRRRLLSLTPKGKSLVKKFRLVWESIAAVAADLLDSTECNLLEALDQIEAELDKSEFYVRHYEYTGGKHA